MAADPKKIAALIVAKGAPTQPSMPADPGAEPDQDDDEGQQAAASEMIDAVQSKNAGAFATALKSFIAMCNS